LCNRKELICLDIPEIANTLFEFCQNGNEEGFNNYYYSLTEKEKIEVQDYMNGIKDFIEKSINKPWRTK
jgi:hypothetical protein